jgi:iron(III) transport system ATP-binding protein
VADFIGQGEFLLGEVVSPDSFQTEVGVLKTDKGCAKAVGRKVDVLFRPDDIIPDESGNVLARVVEKAFKGAEILYTLQLPSGSRLLSLFPSHRNHTLGEEVRVRIDAQHLICFPHQG